MHNCFIYCESFYRYGLIAFRLKIIRPLIVMKYLPGDKTSIRKKFLVMILANFSPIRCRRSRSQMFFSLGVLKIFPKLTGKHLCLQICLFNKLDYNFILKKASTQVFSCEFCEYFKSSFLYRTSPVATSNVEQHNLKDSQIRQSIDNMTQVIESIIAI